MMASIHASYNAVPPGRCFVFAVATSRFIEFRFCRWTKP